MDKTIFCTSTYATHLEAFLGDYPNERNHMGADIPVFVYRLFQYSLKEELISRYGKETAVDLFRAGGRTAGIYFARHHLDLALPLGQFTAMLQQKLEEFKIGILRIETFDENTGQIILTVSEDADCSGLPIMGEAVCNFDEGFISGILSLYTNKNYEATEINCWALGERICRFDAHIIE